MGRGLYPEIFFVFVVENAIFGRILAILFQLGQCILCMPFEQIIIIITIFIIMDPETGLQWLRTLFLLFLGLLLLSDFQSTKTCIFHNRSSLSFPYRSVTIFSTKNVLDFQVKS